MIALRPGPTIGGERPGSDILQNEIMQSAFTKSFFINNRLKLRAELPEDYPIVLIANGSLQRTADTTFPFQQESSFWYLTGLNEPDIIFVMHPTYEYIILPHTDSVKAIFDGSIDIPNLKLRSGISQTYNATEGWNKLIADLKHDKALYTIYPEPEFEKHSRIYANPAQRHALDKLRRHISGIKLHNVTEQVAEMRMRKQPPEVAAIETAVQITTETIKEIRLSKNLVKLQTEYALEAAITNGFRSRGASGHAYAPIVASGDHAATLHYVSNNGSLNAKELIVADVGAEFEHYAADITRTFSLTKPTTRQQAILSSVIGVQHRAAELLRPGVLLREYEQTVAKYIGEALYDLKLTANKQDIHAIRKYFPHASSHFLGLDVHDAGNYDIPLEASMVLTCEPGIYIPEEGIGVRIEDDIIITDTGNRNMSDDCSYSAYNI